MLSKIIILDVSFSHNCLVWKKKICPFCGYNEHMYILTILLWVLLLREEVSQNIIYIGGKFQ